MQLWGQLNYQKRFRKRWNNSRNLWKGRQLFACMQKKQYLCCANYSDTSNYTNMKKLLLCILSMMTMGLQAVNYCANQSWGYAGTSVTGGGSATPTLVTSVSGLKSALGSKAKNKVVIITKDLTFTSMV